MMRIVMAVTVGILASSNLDAYGDEKPAAGRQVARSLVAKSDAKERLDYWLYLPKKYDDGKQAWPVILFLHGAGERGDDLQQVKKHGPPKTAGQQAELERFVIVSPQCPAEQRWTDQRQLDLLDQLLTQLAEELRIDKQRIYLTGLSMGGFGSWRLAALHPNRFAAVAPICGGGDPEEAAKLAKLPIWAFHGAKDRAVPLQRSEEMVEAIKKAGGDVKLTIYPEAGHDSWTETYNNPKLYDWLLEQQASP